MKKLLLIALLIVGCDNSTEPQAEDYAGECDGDAVEDCIMGVCTEIPQNVDLWSECYNIQETTSIIIIVSWYNGDIPVEIGYLTNLRTLILNNNQLTGEIPLEIGNLTNLTDFRIYNNQLTGEIPSEIGNLTNLTLLYLNNNKLTSLPESICNIFPNLATFDVSNNKICGELPSCLTAEEIGEQDCP